MNQQILLKSCHVILPYELVKQIFGSVSYAYVSYVSTNQTLLITPVTSEWFAKMHQPTQFLLKDRNLQGDKSIAVREIFIDNDLNETDRSLLYEIVTNTNLIKISISWPTDSTTLRQMKN
ncbi:MAG TPA: hypothetical protein DCS93_39725 [Microscillaceae bacterium]|nr:hypothetical protein [Microscillaceae bacterium]